MKLKYYLRGLGIGMIVTTILLLLTTGSGGETLSDEEIIARASELGMVMEEETGLFEDVAETEESQTETEEAQTGTEEQTQSGTGEAQAETEEAQTQAEESQTAETQTQEVQTQETQAETGSYSLVVKKGDVCRDVCERLVEAGITEDAETLRKYLYEKNVADFISVGTYEIPLDASMEEVAQILSAGPLEKQ